MEVHDDPSTSPVDGPTQWPLRSLRPLLKELIEIGKVTKAKREPFSFDLTPAGEDWVPET
jgi:2-dehydro-3-deoxyphosphooctonate aldolase (KDO 8-P synthase)